VVGEGFGKNGGGGRKGGGGWGGGVGGCIIGREECAGWVGGWRGECGVGGWWGEGGEWGGEVEGSKVYVVVEGWVGGWDSALNILASSCRYVL